MINQPKRNYHSDNEFSDYNCRHPSLYLFGFLTAALIIGIIIGSVCVYLVLTYINDDKNEDISSSVTNIYKDVRESETEKEKTTESVKSVPESSSCTESYEEKAPDEPPPLPEEVSLFDHWVYDFYNNGLYEFSNKKDIYGGVLSEGYYLICGFMQDSKKASKSYWIEDEGFTAIRFKIAVSSDSRGGKGKGAVTIYGDEKELFKEADITSAYHTKEFEVNISDIKDLKVELSTSGDVFVMIAESTLCR